MVKNNRILFFNSLIVSIMFFTQFTFAQTPKDPLYIDLSRTLGFIMGQSFSLNRIKTEYPSLSLQVKKTELEFETSFGIAEKNIKKTLKELMKDKYPEYISMMEKQLDSTLSSQKITQDIALNFINEVELRSKGKIPSPTIETLLTYQFLERPANEFARGFKNVFRTKKHPKAKGLDMQFEYPKSWSKREGNRPNVIQVFSSNNGRGPANVLIMVRDLFVESNGELNYEDRKAFNTLDGCKEIASEIFTENSLKYIVSGMGVTNIQNINTKKITLDRWPGAMIEFTGDQQRLDFNLRMYNRMYIALYKNYMIFFQCQIGKYPNETEDGLKTKVLQFTPLFRFMANSLIIQNQY